ncbi:hypothetical protein KDL45_01835, partial [bacterium]|nr:hypothetical protein [bacterium]
MALWRWQIRSLFFLAVAVGLGAFSSTSAKASSYYYNPLDGYEHLETLDFEGIESSLAATNDPKEADALFHLLQRHN